MRQGFYLKLRRLKNKHLEKIRLHICPTFKCDNDCTYCSRHFTSKMKIKKDEKQLSAEQWLQRVDQFPLKVDQVTISGGEPLLYYDLNSFILGLYERKIPVTIFTNGNSVLSPNLKNPLLRIVMSYHIGTNWYLFCKNVEYYKKNKIRCDLDFLKNDIKFVENLKRRKKRMDKGIIKYNSKEWKECLETKTFAYGPDGQFFTSSGQMWYEYVHGEIKKDIIWDINDKNN